MAAKRKYKNYSQKAMRKAVKLAAESMAVFGSYNNASIARLKGVPERTLSKLVRRLNQFGEVENGDTMNKLLTEQEEDSIVEYIDFKLDTRMTVTRADVLALGNKTLQVKDPNRSVGSSWFKGFMTRHPEFYNRWKNCRAVSRIQERRYKRVKSWFDLSHEIVVEGGISDDNVYNMDETNIQFGEDRKNWTIQRHGETDVKVSESESTESVTILETVSMAGIFFTTICDY